MSVAPTDLTRFEGYEIDRALWQLRRGDDVLPLNRKTFDLLLYLVDHADRVVTKDELLRALWPESFIEESNLTQQIFLLRKALARYAPETRIIETVSGRGYRFAVPVHSAARPDPHAHIQQRSGTGDDSPRIQPISSEDAAREKDPGARRQAATSYTALSQEKPGSLRLIDRTGQHSGMPWTIGAAAATSLILLALYLLLGPHRRSHIRISTYTQITHDGHAKSIGGTDGSRIYFTRLEKSSIAQVPIAGGAEALMPLALQDPWSGEVSPDGSTLLIISQAGGQGPASSLWALQLVGGSLHRLGNAISSAWSPDGDNIVYASAKGELFLMRRDGSDAHRIASVGGSVSSIAWSPEGHTIRFCRDGLLWQVSPDGSNARQLLPGRGKTPTQWSGHWAPDGTYFFVADGQIWVLENGSGLFRKRTPSPVQLTYGPTVWDRPISTPDGKRILASGRASRGELVRFDPTSRQPKAFLAGLSAEFVTFSKSANAVAYVSYPDGVLWRANVDGSNPVRLTEPPIYPKSICWSPDGLQLAFVDRTADSVASIFTIAADGTGKPHRLLPGDREAENDPSWSPDGRRLVFSTSPNVGASAKSDLHLVDLQTDKTSVLSGSDGLLVPRWSPDGHSVAAMTLDANGLRILDLSNGRWSSLDTGAVAFPEWSHDGRWIYYVRWTTNPAILRLRAADGKREVVADLAGARYTGFYTLWMGLDPEDTPLMLRDAGTDDIYALTLQRE